MTLAPERPTTTSGTGPAPRTTAPQPPKAGGATNRHPSHEVGTRHTVAAHHDPSTRLAVHTDEVRTRPAVKRSGRPTPGGHLTQEDIEGIGRELDAIREEVMASRGARDAAYIRRVIKVQRYLELGSRATLLLSGVKVGGWHPAFWVGTAGLSLAKILENMEIGHNVMHGQWDWMRDPKVHSTAWEWDNASPSSQWKHSHNQIHHTFTNVLGRDNDLGYGILRVDEDQRWTLACLGQPVYHVINALIFEYSIAAYDLELGGYLAKRKRATEEEKADFRRRAREVTSKIARQAKKDYLVHPLLAAPFGGWAATLGANVVANLVRNVWTNTVIICGHFPKGVSTFDASSLEGETRGEWYLRQLLGSCNISGSKLMHVMTGNLSHQIEHHLFPDMPSNRYAEVAPRVRELMARHGLQYVSGPLWKQAANVYWRVGVLSLPNKQPGRSRWDIIRLAYKKAQRRGGVLRNLTRPGH